MKIQPEMMGIEQMFNIFAIPADRKEADLICTEIFRTFAGKQMKMKREEAKQSRFELRLSKEDKMFFEEASQLAGYRTLSGFVISAVREYASKIIREKERILLSQKDKELFFEAVFSGMEPNEKLKKASEKYLKSQSAK